MKKIIILAVLFMLSLNAAPQSYPSADYDDYAYDVASDLDLTGEQWHTDEASILAANNSQYLVVRGTERYRYTLCPLNIPAFERIWHKRITLYSPYFYQGYLGWHVVADLIHYFIYPDGRWCRLVVEPYYYPYRYHIAHCRRINFFDWHFWYGRHHRNYHGTCYHMRRPPVHRPNRDYHRPSPPRPMNNSRPPQRTTGRSYQPERQPPRTSYSSPHRAEQRNSRVSDNPLKRIERGSTRSSYGSQARTEQRSGRGSYGSQVRTEQRTAYHSSGSSSRSFNDRSASRPSRSSFSSAGRSDRQRSSDSSPRESRGHR